MLYENAFKKRISYSQKVENSYDDYNYVCRGDKSWKKIQNVFEIRKKFVKKTRSKDITLNTMIGIA